LETGSRGGARRDWAAWREVRTVAVDRMRIGTPWRRCLF
jgi:hypothetical protein